MISLVLRCRLTPSLEIARFGYQTMVLPGTGEAYMLDGEPSDEVIVKFNEER